MLCRSQTDVKKCVAFDEDSFKVHWVLFCSCSANSWMVRLICTGSFLSLFWLRKILLLKFDILYNQPRPPPIPKCAETKEQKASLTRFNALNRRQIIARDIRSQH